jgi:hypothetical protein
LRKYLQVKVHHRYKQHQRQNCCQYQRHQWQICHRYQRHLRQILPPIPLVVLIPVAGVDDTGGKFAIGVNDTGGKFATVSTALAANCHRGQ